MVDREQDPVGPERVDRAAHRFGGSVKMPLVVRWKLRRK
jgi:hypothetical protein